MARGSRRSASAVAALLFVAATTTSLVATVGGPAQVASAQTPTYTNPLLNFPVLNPFVLKGTVAPNTSYYSYFSGYDWPPDQYNVPLTTSPDLTSTSPGGIDVMPDASVGAWADTSSGTKFGSPAVLHVSGNPVGSRYVLYFTGTQVGTGKRCIGTAVAASPLGPFDGADTPLLCPSDGEAVEPSLSPMGDSPPFQQLVYRKIGTNPGIYNQLLTADGQAINTTFTPNKLLLLTGSAEHWSGGVVERPALTTTPTGLVRLLFSGVDPVTGTRAVGYAPCSALGVIVSCTAGANGGRWFGSAPGAVSPGGVQVFRNGTDQWITYHALPGPCTGAACTAHGTQRIDKLCFADNRPRTNAPSTTAQALSRSSTCTADIPSDWMTTWTAATHPDVWNLHPQFSNETAREMVHTATGGSAVRVRLSNRFGSADLRVDKASVAVSTLQQGATSAVQGTPVPLAFGGSPGVTIPAGKEVLSDAVAITVPGDRDVAVSLYMPATPPPPGSGGHSFGKETSFIGNGDLVASPGGGTVFDESTYNVHFVSAVEVLATAPLGTAAVVGDSLTDGMFGLHGLDAETMWTDVENFDLQGAGSSQLSVVNQAIAGNKLLPASDPMSVLGRLDHDALALTGVRTVVVEIGANDLVAGSTSTQILAGLQQVIDRAHAAGLRVVGATIPPYAWRDSSVSAPCYDNAITPAEQGYENQRQATNLRIRPGQPNSLNFDAVVDFDAALRWTTDPRRPADTYLGWDCIHLNPTGHRSLATAVPPSALLP